jgi:hypothetical protein
MLTMGVSVGCGNRFKAGIVASILEHPQVILYYKPKSGKK